MPRRSRSAIGGTVHHVVHRGNRRHAIFFEPADYDGFLQLLGGAGCRHAVALLAYCLMPNHWHLVVRPATDHALSTYVRWVGTTHVRRHHAKYGTTGTGHLYQGRFRNFLVQDDRYLQMVLRYVEANPRRAGLVARAEEWKWCSLYERTGQAARHLLAPWPLPSVGDWVAYVNISSPASELHDLRVATARGVPFGGAAWTQKSPYGG